MEVVEVGSYVNISLATINFVLITAIVIDTIIRKFERRRRLAEEEKRKREQDFELRLREIELQQMMLRNRVDRIERNKFKSY